MGQLLTEVCARLQVQAPAAVPHPSWAPVREHFPLLAIVDGSTLEALRQKTQVLQQRESPVLGGGLLVFDLGFFSFLWFDDFTTSHRFFVTCMREKTAYRTVRELSSSPYYRDAIIAVGQYRSNPCQYPLRMVSVQWEGVWYRYLTNVLDTQVLSARHVCELYRRRWRIEDAFALTKRILDLAYLWTGSPNAIQLQIYATLIFYAVLLTICQQVALAPGEPLERIWVEMVCRALYHYGLAVQRGEDDDLILFLTEHAKLLGIVKRWRKRHRESQQLESLIWGEPSVETGGVRRWGPYQVHYPGNLSHRSVVLAGAR